MESLRNSAPIGKIHSATLTSCKPVATLRDSQFIVERGIELDELKEETVIFEGLPKRPRVRVPERDGGIAANPITSP